MKTAKQAGGKTEKYDIVILGSGEGGKYIAWTMAKKGKSVALIERKYVGGSCPNIACLPSKNIIHSAKVASYFFRSTKFGITKENTQIHMSMVRDRKRKMVDGLVQMHLDNFKTSGAELIIGTGTFVGPRTIEVALADGGKRTLTGENVVISTGSRAAIDAIPGLADARPMTHVEALDLDQVPGRLLILGGGYVGLEFAQAMRRFGSNVTIIECNSHLAHREDPDVRDLLQQIFRDEGIEIITNAQVTQVAGKSGDHVKLIARQDGREIVLTGTHLLVASGRTPNTNGIGLDPTGIKTTERGHIQVNEKMQTNMPGVWAVGDCAGSPHFTHIAFDDYRVVVSALMGGARVTTGRQVPSCLFIDPELARIGLNETEAVALKILYRVAKLPMVSVLRTRTLSETRGFLKVLVDEKSDKILGFTAFGVGAGEIMATVQVAMAAGLPYTVLRDMIFTHPTLLEGLVPLFSAIPPAEK